MAAGKHCNLGKSCGATCIDARERCVIELGPAIQKAMPQVRHLIEMLNEHVDEYEAIESPKAGVQWLDKHKEEMASWGLTEAQVEEVIKNKPSYITFGVEPYRAAEPNELVEMYNSPVFKGEGSIRDTKVKKNKDEGGAPRATGPYGDLMYKLNRYKDAYDFMQKVYNDDPDAFPKGLNQAALEVMRGKGQEKETLGRLAENRLIDPNTGKVKGAGLRGDEALEAHRKGNQMDWNRTQQLIREGAGVTQDDFLGANPSGLWKPSKEYEQFRELYEAVGKDPGPFASNATWYRYAGQQQAEKIMRMVKGGEPKLMYFGENGNEQSLNTVATQFQKSGMFGLNGKTREGKPTNLEWQYFVYEHPNGNRTVAVFGNHPAGRGFTMNEDMARAVGQIGMEISKTGEVGKTQLPGDIKLAKTGPLSEYNKYLKGEKMPGGGGGKVASGAKPKAAAAKATPKVETPKQDPNAARQKLVGYVQTLRNQGQKDAQISQSLKKLGIPESLINDVLKG